LRRPAVAARINHRRRFGLIFLVLVLVLAAVVAQQRRFRGFGGSRRFGGVDYLQNPRQMDQHGGYQTPVWTNTPGFEKDVFTFVRIKRRSGGYAGGPWHTDAPDSDLNLAYRLQQMTSIKVNPDGLFLWLTDPTLTEYPFIYMVEPGSLYLDEDEVAALRKYLLNGGFLWVDDFWGDSEWDNLEHVLKRVLPERSFVEVPLNHPLYHGVFDIKAKDQIPNVGVGTASEQTGVTWEYNHDGDVRTVHHKAIFDDRGRIMVFATHNTDNGDGWEWEGDNHYFFEHFSEKIAYPLAINVIFHVMTH
jgi:Domain of unknown function (DUF4159)